MTKIIAFYVLLTFTVNAYSENEYRIGVDQATYAIGIIHGGTIAFEIMKDVCSDNFQDNQLITNNDSAYRLWRWFNEETLNYLDELKMKALKKIAKQNEGEAKQFAKELKDSIPLAKERMKSNMSEDGTTTFLTKCIMYPDYLESDNAKIEILFSTEITTLERFLKNN